MHKTLQVMRVTETEGVELASYLLKEVAYSWFELWEESREEGSPSVKWGEFTDAFIDHFLLAETKPAHAAEFENLRQGRFGPGVKKRFWQDLDEMVRSIPHTKKLFIGGDFNGHIGASARGYDDVHGRFGFRDRNEGANSSFPKREEHLVSFRNSMGKTQIDYLLGRKCDKGLCTDFKVIPSEYFTTLHRLLIMDLEIKRSRKKRTVYRKSKIKWGNLTKDKAQELGEKLLAMRAWMSRGDASGIWFTTVNCIRVAAREVLGVTKGSLGGHRGDWWWNREVQGKVETKKTAYLKLVESTNEEEKKVLSGVLQKGKEKGKVSSYDG
ncbi:uncharacterized protein LOC142177415 [Nicotiana tabacum]|uniref:Uncharacterized protein LOC142177415 n=1 Tax=Nicotiana tabacum TaxID=4097 RepID=A0AC58TXQ5_TOBAC